MSTNGVSASTIQGLTGLASGIDTSSIVNALMQVERAPEKQMQIKKSQSQQRQTLLQDFETKLKALQTAAEGLGDVTMWAPKQSVASSDPTRVSVTMMSGAGVGGTTIDVQRL